MEFKNKSVAVVHSTWEKSGNCYWPPQKISLTKAVKSGQQPSSSWEIHKDVKVLFTFSMFSVSIISVKYSIMFTNLILIMFSETYEGALKGLDRSETQTDIGGSTDQEPDLGLGKRCPKKKIVKDFVTDDYDPFAEPSSDTESAVSDEEEQPVVTSDIPCEIAGMLLF